MNSGQPAILQPAQQEMEMPRFFVPFAEPGKQEEMYAACAALAGTGGRPQNERVYSMTWRHDGVRWTATVGETLRGIETVTTGRGRERREREVPRSTDDTVMAIFPGTPGLIVHDNKSRRWNLPILTGAAINLTLFDPE